MWMNGQEGRQQADAWTVADATSADRLSLVLVVSSPHATYADAVTDNVHKRLACQLLVAVVVACQARAQEQQRKAISHQRGPIVFIVDLCTAKEKGSRSQALPTDSSQFSETWETSRTLKVVRTSVRRKLTTPSISRNFRTAAGQSVSQQMSMATRAQRWRRFCQGSEGEGEKAWNEKERGRAAQGKRDGRQQRPPRQKGVGLRQNRPAESQPHDTGSVRTLAWLRRDTHTLRKLLESFPARVMATRRTASCGVDGRGSGMSGRVCVWGTLLHCRGLSKLCTDCPVALAVRHQASIAA